MVEIAQALTHGPVLIGTNRARAIDSVERAIRANLSWGELCPWAKGKHLANLDIQQDKDELKRIHGEDAVEELRRRFISKGAR